MRISTRLSLAFSFIASSIFIIFGVLVYLFSANHRKNEFQERLQERLVITEQIFLEKEDFNEQELEQIRKQFLKTLPEETEEVIEIRINQKPVFKYDYPKFAKQNLLQTDSYYFEDSTVQGSSKVFRIKGKEYLIIVTAVDKIGLQNLSFLKYRIMLLILIGIPVIFIGSFIITKKALLPLTNKIQYANAMGASNLHQRLKVFNPHDEIGELAIAFNKLLDRLEASFEAQKAFISNASHEIRNPLTAIMGESEIAVSKPRNTEEYITSLNMILEEAETLNTTVNNLLQLSKIAANEESIKFEPVEIYSFIMETKESFDFVNPENRIIVAPKPATSTPFYVAGNKSLLKTAIFNLFDNACKFSSNEKVTVKLTQSENRLKITISDTGIGVSLADIAKIKAPFFRGNNTLKIKGSGIGLSLTDKIINLHKGKLKIQSKINEGTQVTIRLPLA